MLFEFSCAFGNLVIGFVGHSLSSVYVRLSRTPLSKPPNRIPGDETQFEVIGFTFKAFQSVSSNEMSQILMELSSVRQLLSFVENLSPIPSSTRNFRFAQEITFSVLVPWISKFVVRLVKKKLRSPPHIPIHLLGRENTVMGSKHQGKRSKQIVKLATQKSRAEKLLGSMLLRIRSTSFIEMIDFPIKKFCDPR